MGHSIKIGYNVMCRVWLQTLSTLRSQLKPEGAWASGSKWQTQPSRLSHLYRVQEIHRETRFQTLPATCKADGGVLTRSGQRRLQRRWRQRRAGVRKEVEGGSPVGKSSFRITPLTLPSSSPACKMSAARYLHPSQGGKRKIKAEILSLQEMWMDFLGGTRASSGGVMGSRSKPSHHNI